MEETSIAQRIWHRAIAMLFVAMRYEIETRFHSDNLIADDDEFAERVISCFERHQEIRDELTPNERVLLQREIGDWPLNLHIQYSWHIEAVGCLLWCLGEFKEIPAHDITFDMREVDSYFGKISQSGISSWTTSLLHREMEARPITEIQYQLKKAEIVYQRCIIGSYIRDGKRQMSSKRYDDLFPFQTYSLPIGPGGDLLVDDKEFCDMSHDEEGDLAPLALVRIQTFRWVLNQDMGWDDLCVDDLEELPE